MFPALFPNDELVGRNHFADADALMCRKVVSYCLEAFSLEPNLPKVGKLQATLRQTWDRASATQSSAKRKCYVPSDDEEEYCIKRVRNAQAITASNGSHTASSVATQS